MVRNLRIDMVASKEILLKGGAKEGNIQIKIADCDSEQSVSDKILEELNRGQYDTLLVSKHEATKTQEFFFGDTTLNLIASHLSRYW